MKNAKKSISIGVMLALLALFTAVALYSYEEKDWGRFWGVANLCGPIGSAFAGSLRYLFGPLFSWFWPVLLLYWASLVARGRSISENWPRITSCFVMLWALFSLIRIAAGGEWGGNLTRVTTDLLELVTGRIGSVLILLAILLLTSIILFFGSMKQFFGRISSLEIGRLFGWIRARRTAKPKIETKKRRQRQPAKKEAVEDVPEDEPPIKIAISKPEIPKPTPKPKPSSAPRPSDPSASVLNAPLPELSLLDAYAERKTTYSKDELLARSDIIKRKLQDYGLDGTVNKVRPGPVVTTFEYVPAAGVKVSQIANRSDDISLALAARAIRIQAPIPGKGAVGIEVPNPEPQLVDLREMLEHYPVEKEGLWVSLGKTVTGEPFYADLADMPHLLIAGATGSGKSVCINSIICSLLFHHTPATCRFVMVDPKRLELITYNGIPHLLHHVITEAKQTLKVLEWMTLEMGATGCSPR